VSARQFHLYIIETNSERANGLRVELSPLSQVTVVENYADAAKASEGLDAIFVSLMSAIEWGTVPIPAPIHQTRVVKVPDDEIASGRPQYAIPGVAINPGESLDPIECTRLVLRESFRAIDVFNETSTRPLAKIAAVSTSLGFDKLENGQAGVLLSEAYRLSSVILEKPPRA
jgi:hypothetical protein